MNLFTKLFRSLWYALWYLFAATVVLMAAVFASARLLLPLVDDYNQDIEKYAEKLLGRPIKIMSMDAEWHGFSPSLVLNNVRLLNSDNSETLLHFSRARIDLDVIDTLMTQKIQFRKFALSGVNLSIVRLEDGVITLTGFEQNNLATDEDTAFFSSWLLQQGEISIHAKNLLYQDRRAGKKRYHFSNVSLVLRNDGNRHLIDGAISLPRDSNQEFIFAIEMLGNFMETSEWSGQMYFNASNVNVNDIFGIIVFQGHKFTLGESNFEIWTDWDNASLTGLRGDISLHKIKIESDTSAVPLLSSIVGDSSGSLASAAHSIEGSALDRPAEKNRIKSNSAVLDYDQVIGRFNWDKYPRGWKLQADRFVIARDKRIWLPSQLLVHYINDWENRSDLTLKTSFLRIEDLLPVLPVLFGPEWEYQKGINFYNPRGDIKNFNLHWGMPDRSYQIAAILDGVSISEHKKLPGFENLSGDIWSTNGSGVFRANTINAYFKHSSMFRTDIPLQSILGDVEWNTSESGLTVSSNNLRITSNGMETKSVLDLSIPSNDESPFLSLISKFSGGNIRHASTYYPVSIMPESAVRWLDVALLEGDVVSGGAIVYGPLRDFPFTGGNGVFETRFNFNNALLDYAENWPQIYELSGEAVFRGKQMEINAESGKLLSSTLRKVKIDIPSFAKPKVEVKIKGIIAGQTQDKLNFVMLSPPLNEKLGDALSDLKVAGESELDLGLILTIGKEIESSLNASLNIKNNKVSYGPLTDILTNTNGVLKIYDDGSEAKAIRADLFGQPSIVNIERVKSKKSGNTHTIRLVARGRYDSQELVAEHFPWLKDLVKGKSRWTVALDLPAVRGEPEKSKRPREVNLAVYSSMKGVEISLPPPFRKDRQDIRKFNYFIDFKKDSKAIMRVSYAGQFDGLFDVDLKDGIRLNKGEARFGGGPTILPKKPGLRIVGEVAEFSLDTWKNLFTQFSSSTGSEQNDNTAPEKERFLPEYLHTIDVNIGKAEVMAQEARNLHLQLSDKGQWYLIKLDSKQWLGEIKIPIYVGDEAISLDMQHIILTSAESSGGSSDPRNLPAFKLNSRQVNFKDKRLGHVAIETAKTKNGILLQQIIVKPRDTTIKGHGSWLFEDGKEVSRYEFVLDSNNLGNSMQDLGYVNTIQNGAGKINAKVNWIGSLGNIDFDHFNGKVGISFKNGRILELDPGAAARIFGLFSLQTLPRRLALDFSDLFSKGIGFDKVEGHFKIEDGNAYTEDFYLEGPSANVLIQGRIGLKDQDYDQKITVTPHITDMAVLLSIITSQPILFFMQQLMKSDIDKATSLEYTLSGSWDNFKVEPIFEKSKSPPASDDAEL